MVEEEKGDSLSNILFHLICLTRMKNASLFSLIVKNFHLLSRLLLLTKVLGYFPHEHRKKVFFFCFSHLKFMEITLYKILICVILCVC